MHLYHKTFGQGHPLIILHGLLGSSDNWQTLGKKLAEDYMVYLVDLRNHGRSPDMDTHSYPEMVEDLRAFLEENWIHEAHVLGHSMGGKVAMQLALTYPDLVDKLVVVDIAPRAYEPGHEIIFKALKAVDIDTLTSRGEAEEAMEPFIPQKGVRQFLLKSLKRTDDGFAWKMNLKVLDRDYENIIQAVESKDPFPGPTLFVAGGKSDYLTESDEPMIRELFPKARIEVIPGAGHWVHAEAPGALLELLRNFLT